MRTEKWVLFLVLITLSFNSFAATAICSGEVYLIAYHEPDGVYLEVGTSKIIKVCSLKQQYFRTDPENCQLIVSLASMAKATGQQLLIYIDNAPDSICSNIPAWFGADVRYVQLKG